RRFVRVNGKALKVADKIYSLDALRHVYVIGAGKAVVPMAQALEALLGERLSGGIVVTKYGQALPSRRVRVIEAAHPIPDLNGVEGARQIAAIAELATAHDLVFVLISGGGSALLPYPLDGLTLEDKQI